MRVKEIVAYVEKVFGVAYTIAGMTDWLHAHSPNLNPIERLWKFVNEQVLYNKYNEKFSAFKEAVLGFLRNLFDPCPELKRLLQSRITDIPIMKNWMCIDQ